MLTEHISSFRNKFLKNGKDCLINYSAKKRLPSYFAIAAWTLNFILHFHNALDVSSPKMERGKYFLHALFYVNLGHLIF